MWERQAWIHPSYIRQCKTPSALLQLSKCLTPFPFPTSRQVWAPTYSGPIKKELPLSWCYIYILKLFPRLSLPPNLLLPSTKGVSYLVTHPVGQIRGRMERGYISLPLPPWPLGSTCLQSRCEQLCSLNQGNVGPPPTTTRKPCGFLHRPTEGKLCLILEEIVEGPLLSSTQATLSGSSVLVIKLPLRIKISIMWIPNGGELTRQQGRWKGFGILVDQIYTSYG